ncbi:MAG: hypothetical protein L6262_05875 [Weeksellaceae bacterium]|nr:hypothetical protein [Weeksellaceae bacterium]
MKNLVLSLALLTSAFSFAQQADDRNLVGERRRVAEGVKAGEINKKEAVVIHKKAKDVKQAKRAAVADGQVTPQERAAVARQDRQLDRTIYRKKHN